MNIANELITAMRVGQSSKRKNQKTIGPSEFGGCERKTWLKLHDQPVTNPNTIMMSAVMGTAIHTYIQDSFTKLDPWGERFIMELELKVDDITGHVDMYDKENQLVVDWKTTKKNNIKYFPSLSQRWQVQLYGYLLTENNYPVKNVSLVAIPRDGDERDIYYHEEPYDINTVKDALNWYRAIEAMESSPPPGKESWFCQYYCKYYDPSGEVGCAGIPSTRKRKGR